MLNRLLLAAAVIPAIILSANAQQVIEPAPNGVVTFDASRTGMTRIACEGQLRAVLGVQSHASVTPRLSRIIRASHYLKPVRLA